MEGWDGIEPLGPDESYAAPFAIVSGEEFAGPQDLCLAYSNLKAAALRVTGAFARLGKTTNVVDQLESHRECEAAMLALAACGGAA